MGAMTCRSTAFHAILLAACLGAATSLAADDLGDALSELRAAEAGHDALAEKAREIWSRSGSESMDFLLRRGREAIEAEDWPAAIDHLTALTDWAPEFAEGWHARARALYGAGYAGPALDDLRRAIALEPRHFDALAGAAFMLSEQGRTDAARTLLREALRLNPELGDAKELLDSFDREAGARTL